MVELSAKEQERADIFTAAIERKITNDHAARQLGISVRQVKRMKAAIRKHGVAIVVHGLKGKPSNHRYDEEVKTDVLQKITRSYHDFKPKFATEKLQETDGIPMTSQTIRVWMTEVGLWKPRRQKQVHYYAWRARKEYFGELEQFDGSYHYWLEDRYKDREGTPLEMCLLAAIDDATGQITRAEFAEHEGVVPVFRFWKGYVEEETLGKPVSIYLDRFSTYRINHKNALDNSELKTQFQRCMESLGIHVIFATSPQAKGRVERLFETLQDRLVKEMRLVGIITPEEANSFLKEVFIPKFNKQFGVTPAKEGNLHKVLTTEEKTHIQHIFSIHETRRVNNDFTIQFQNNFYQLTEIQPTTVRPQEKVIMETFLDGSVHIIQKEHELRYFLLPKRPKKQRIQQPIILTTHTLNWKPTKDHPWRKFKYGKG